MRTLLILIFSYSFAQGQNPWKDVYKETSWAQRDTWQRPREILKFLNLERGSTVADIGCHEGYFTVKLAEEVESTGKVFAVDISQNKLDKLKKHLATRRINNVRAILGKPDNPNLPAQILNAVLIVDTYHEIAAHAEMLRHLRGALKPGGRIVLCEPISEAAESLSREEQQKKHELGINYALNDLQKAGFRILFKQENFVDRTQEKGDRMWIIVAERPDP